MAITRKVKLIFSDLSANSYKQWRAELHDDGRVISRFSAVGSTEQEKDYGCVGEAFLEKKIKEKTKKGYEFCRVLENEGAQIVSRGSLADIAVSQIKFSNEAIKSLIRRLADANVHKITETTSIKFDSVSGLFETPLGVVQKEAIDEARLLLSWFNDNRKINKEYKGKIDSYLKLVPRTKGRKLSYEGIFPDLDAIKKESDVLDALDNSLEILAKPKAADPSVAAPIIQQVFKLKFDVLDEDKERDRISKWFYSSNHRTHGYSNVKIEEIYAIQQDDVPFKSSYGNCKEVFHGTLESGVLSCLKSGLKGSPPSTCSISGKMWAARNGMGGIYGALDSSKSLQYSFGRFSGSGGSSKAHIFVCDFACGRMEIPKRYSGGPDLKDWDSCWAQPKHTSLRFDEVVCYYDDQVKIKYLIIAK